MIKCTQNNWDEIRYAYGVIEFDMPKTVTSEMLQGGIFKADVTVTNIEDQKIK